MWYLTSVFLEIKDLQFTVSLKCSNSKVFPRDLNSCAAASLLHSQVQAVKGHKHTQVFAPTQAHKRHIDTKTNIHTASISVRILTNAHRIGSAFLQLYLLTDGE